MFDKLKKLNLDWNLYKKNNNPFPHIVIKDILTNDDLEIILNNFPSVDVMNWRRFNNNLEKKLASTKRDNIPTPILNIIDKFNSQEFLDFLTNLTGIENLISDYDLVGGGLHQIENGGKLAIHSDFGLHTINNETVYRRINVLIYLNKDWKDNYNGHLQLVDEHSKKIIKSISPDINTMVIFNTDSDSFHGHPIPLNVPKNITRKSIALYYYTKERPKGKINTDTVFL